MRKWGFWPLRWWRIRKRLNRNTHFVWLTFFLSLLFLAASLFWASLLNVCTDKHQDDSHGNHSKEERGNKLCSLCIERTWRIIYLRVWCFGSFMFWTGCCWALSVSGSLPIKEKNTFITRTTRNPILVKIKDSFIEKDGRKMNFFFFF